MRTFDLTVFTLLSVTVIYCSYEEGNCFLLHYFLFSHVLPCPLVLIFYDLSQCYISLVVMGLVYQTNAHHVRLKVFTAVTMKNAVLWDVAPFSSCVDRRIVSIFRVEKYLSEEPAWAGGYRLNYLLMLVPRSRIFLPRRWRRYVLPKSRFTQELNSPTSQKTIFFK
jgi:hypothetical protein